MTAAAHEAHLEPRLVGDISGNFYVPAYQRGYRWGQVEVRRLLDDIWESREKDYYLQPVVVKELGDEWELVDGQQRLTTLFLVFKYMENEGLQSSGAAYTMRYETRPDSGQYLKSLDEARSQRNIDFFHINEAYRCIREWFDAHGSRRQYVANKFYEALFEHVRVIWYLAPNDLDAVTLFTRLNVGRIPLTDAELVKALLLSRTRSTTSGTDRSYEIAAQWDSIERDLRDPELWAFVTGKASEEPTHISLLLDTIAGGPTGRDRPLFHTFETLRPEIIADPLALWERVVDLHSLVLGWHDNRDLFHKIGYLVAEGKPFAELIRRADRKSKSDFESVLDGLIRDSLRLTDDQLRELAYGSEKSAKALLLHNVETVRQRQHSSERYSFKEHALGKWSLEHIHAQNTDRLSRADQWTAWLQLHRKALAALDVIDPVLKQEVLDRVDQALALPTLKEADFRPLERDLTDLLSEDDMGADSIDSIANLALLNGNDNSALSNSVFAVKRAEILERDRNGSYIPVATRNAFLKYYTPGDDQQMHFWSRVDRAHYLEALIEALSPYLKKAEMQA